MTFAASHKKINKKLCYNLFDLLKSRHAYGGTGYKNQSQIVTERNKIYLISVFLIYCVLTFIGALKHELWFDEAQAWCIVRDNGFSEIIYQLRYEGHPALWYIILLPFARLGFSCEIIPFISWGFGTAAAWFVLFKAPFGDILKMSVLLSGGFLFYNSVMSRPYSLIQLLLCAVAVVYPDRKKSPILFGTLIALLANTHAIMCGAVAFFGICMIVDLLSDIKINSAKQNIYAVAGIFIAGSGVIVLILTLIGSVLQNDIEAKPSGITAESFENLALVFSDAMKRAIFSAFNVPFRHFVASVAAVVILFFLILFRYNRKCLAGELVFIFFYAIINGLVWRNSTSRAHILIFVSVIFYWISFNEERKVFIHKTDGIKSKIALTALKVDENGKKYCCIILSSILLCTTPAAAYTLAADIFGDFSPSRKMAMYIRENITTDTVLLSYSHFPPQVAAYLPEYTFYSIEYGDYISYCTHAVTDKKDSAELPEFEKACEIRLADNDGYIFLADGYIPFDVNYRYIAIYDYDRKNIS